MGKLTWATTEKGVETKPRKIKKARAKNKMKVAGGGAGIKGWGGSNGKKKDRRLRGWG